MRFQPAGSSFGLFLLDPRPGKLSGLDVSTCGSPGRAGLWLCSLGEEWAGPPGAHPCSLSFSGHSVPCWTFPWCRGCTQKNSLLKKLYPCKCLLFRVSSSVLVQPQLQGLSKPRAPSPDSIWGHSGSRTCSWQEKRCSAGLRASFRDAHTSLPLSQPPLCPRTGLMVPSDVSPL